MSQPITLTGLTRDHPRACKGLFAETERYNQSQTEVILTWENTVWAVLKQRQSPNRLRNLT